MASFKSDTIKKIAVLTSGGDAPGMNAAIRSTVRTAITEGLDVIGVIQGYTGLIEGSIQPLDLRSMANVIQKGGTLLKTGRSQDFMTPQGRQKALQNLQSQNIDALICIGGNGSLQGAHVLWQEHQFPVVGVPATIDNDIFGTDLSIGFDTAVNTALEAIDRIRDTAASHDRLFIVEVMGRNSGHLAIEVGLAGGAEEIFIPENPITVDHAIQQIQRGMGRGKKSSILITAEGQKPGRAYDLAEAIRKKAGFEAKVCILGHIQRGGSPTAVDRNLASRMGSASVKVLKSGTCDVMVAIQSGQIVTLDLNVALQKQKVISKEYIELANTLSN